MIASSGYIIATPDAPDWRLWMIAGGSAAALVLTKWNPLWFLAAGGAIGGFLLS